MEPKDQRHLIVNHTAQAVRLDKMLADAFPDRSRVYFHDLIEQGQVTLGGVTVLKASLRVPPGGQVEVLLVEPTGIELVPQPLNIEIIDVQDDFMVINKPVGLTVHPSASNPHEITLVHGLIHQFPELAAFESEERPGIVHRLDKGASGLLLVARTDRGRDKLIDLFKSHRITKRYSVIVYGHTAREGEVNLPIGRHPVQRQKMTCNGLAAKPAHTRYEVVRYGDRWTLLDVWITTGRTHQIRVHMAQLGHPVLGDGTYGSAVSKKIRAPRLMLHAAELKFEYDGKFYIYTAEAGLDAQL